MNADQANLINHGENKKHDFPDCTSDALSLDNRKYPKKKKFLEDDFDRCQLDVWLLLILAVMKLLEMSNEAKSMVPWRINEFESTTLHEIRSLIYAFMHSEELSNEILFRYRNFHSALEHFMEIESQYLPYISSTFSPLNRCLHISYESMAKFAYSPLVFLSDVLEHADFFKINRVNNRLSASSHSDICLPFSLQVGSFINMRHKLSSIASKSNNLSLQSSKNNSLVHDGDHDDDDHEANVFIASIESMSLRILSDLKSVGIVDKSKSYMPPVHNYIFWKSLFAPPALLTEKYSSDLNAMTAYNICNNRNSVVSSTISDTTVKSSLTSDQISKETNNGRCEMFIPASEFLKENNFISNKQVSRNMDVNKKFDRINVKEKNIWNHNNDIITLKKSKENYERSAYKILLGGEVREDIIDWVLSMKLSLTQKTSEEDIAGLHSVKKLIRDKIINPILRPDLHVGLHKAPRGILLFGQPGTGKTTLAKWLSSESGAQFFEVTPSALISKFYGETETLVKTLFKVAEIDSPSIVFIDEIDSLLGKRRDKDEDSTIRMKNQLLQMMDGVSSDSSKMVVVVGATNRPDMLDEAALRRLTKRVLVPLPDVDARVDQIRKLLGNSAPGGYNITAEELKFIAQKLEGWNGSDLRALCTKAAEYSYDEAIVKFQGINNIPDCTSFRPIVSNDFTKALDEVHPSTCGDNAIDFKEWARKFGAL